jgi:hypothetical protein
VLREGNSRRERPLRRRILVLIYDPEETMLAHQRRTALALAAVAAGCLLGTACGGGAHAGSAGRSETVPSSSASSPTSADWTRQANEICTRALPDASHSMVEHFDSQHIKRHGMAVVLAGSALDELGPPPGIDDADYERMLDMYKESAIRHGRALHDLTDGNAGNAVAEYAIGLDLADRADRLAVGFGASECARFGMTT